MPSENRPGFQQLLFIETNCHVTIEGTQHGLIICFEQHTEIAKRWVKVVHRVKVKATTSSLWKYIKMIARNEKKFNVIFKEQSFLKASRYLRHLENRFFNFLTYCAIILVDNVIHTFCVYIPRMKQVPVVPCLDISASGIAVYSDRENS